MTKEMKKLMLDFLEHCKVILKLPEVEAYAGKWSPLDEGAYLSIRTLIEKVDEWQKRATAMLCSGPPEYDGTDLFDFVKEIRDFGKKEK